ncbi:hypothetical protein [Brevundimonas viscosa]|uniref:hypothetical protein n=1 Tax=Brevundimonas viscosa TaxID=871741 RepID=UPI000B86F1AB|nr:hypothetical protein [Brevundimonas viscosa]
MTEGRIEPEAEATPEAEFAPRLSRLDKSQKLQAKTEMYVAGVGCLGVLALVLWGLYAAGVGAAKGVATVMREGAEVQALLAEGDARDRPRDPAYSDAAVMGSAMSRVKDKLVDPGSARFRNVNVVLQPSGTKAVCGEVNAKSRAGGYSGYEHFISAGTAEFTWLESQVPDFATAWNEVCVR